MKKAKRKEPTMKELREAVNKIHYGPYTLKDLRKQDEFYFFPNSGVGRTKVGAEKILAVCNYTGRLTDVLTADFALAIIADIKRMQDSISRLRDTEAFMRNKLGI